MKLYDYLKRNGGFVDKDGVWSGEGGGAAKYGMTTSTHFLSIPISDKGWSGWYTVRASRTRTQPNVYELVRIIHKYIEGLPSPAYRVVSMMRETAFIKMRYNQEPDRKPKMVESYSTVKPFPDQVVINLR